MASNNRRRRNSSTRVCAGLGAVAAAGAIWALLTHRTRQTAHVGLPAAAVGALAVVAMLQGATHVHSHGDATEAAHHHEAVAEVPVAGDDDTHAADDAASNGHPHGDNSTGTTQPGTDAASGEPTARGPQPPGHDRGTRQHPSTSPASPGSPPNSSSGPRRSSPTRSRCCHSSPTRARSKRSATTPSATPPPASSTTSTSPTPSTTPSWTRHKPESLVYEVDGDRRTLVSAMYTAGQMAIDDPELIDYGGPLMQWHVHNNLCWASNDDGTPHVVALTDDHGGTCPPGTVLAGGDIPMVHVWITPHECGPFAALEGHGAGQANAAPGQRVDQCAHDPSSHRHGGEHAAAAATTAPTTRPS